MKKYEKLAKQYSTSAAEIKRLDAAVHAAADDLNETDYETSTGAQIIALERALDIAQEAYIEAATMLRADIEAEYAAVPFAGPREAGVVATFQALGLDWK